MNEEEAYALLDRWAEQELSKDGEVENTQR
jgi:hypothetical protein